MKKWIYRIGLGGLGLAIFAGAAAAKGVGRQGFDIGLDAACRNRGRCRGNESEGKQGDQDTHRFYCGALRFARKLGLSRAASLA